MSKAKKQKTITKDELLYTLAREVLAANKAIHHDEMICGCSPMIVANSHNQMQIALSLIMLSLYRRSPDEIAVEDGDWQVREHEFLRVESADEQEANKWLISIEGQEAVEGIARRANERRRQLKGKPQQVDSEVLKRMKEVNHDN